MDFQSEWDENRLELMAKGIRTQPTSRNPIPTSQNLNFVSLHFSVFMFFVICQTENRVFELLPEQSSTGPGEIDAD